MTEMQEIGEQQACRPAPLDAAGFNPDAQIPFGLHIRHIGLALQEFLDFLGLVNGALHTKRIARLESFLMPANFSSMVGEFLAAAIPRHCRGLVKNNYHNGHPDLIPAGRFAGNAVQHGQTGIEIKGSRKRSGWQGHNAEDCWLMVFVFDSNTARDALLGIAPKPFRFRAVYGAQLVRCDWKPAGRSETSRRTVTASVARSGHSKMTSNWIYRDWPGH